MGVLGEGETHEISKWKAKDWGLKENRQRARIGGENWEEEINRNMYMEIT